MVENVGYVKQHKGKGVVCYLDLLGFSNDILSRWDSSESNPLDIVMELKKTIQEYNDTPSLILNSGKRAEDVTKYSYCVKTISDSIVILMPIHRITHANLIFSLLGLTIAVSALWKICLAHGYTIRGGIEYGDIYWDQSEVIGPAFINAYRIESKIANYSRIVCGQGFIDLLVDISEKVGPVNKMLLNQFCMEADNFVCINPNAMKRCSDEPEDRYTVTEEIVNNICHLMDDKNDYIKAKYLPLLQSIKNDIIGELTLEMLKSYYIPVK